MLSWKEYEEILVDVEITLITLNNRPLRYLEDDPKLPVLTPSSMLCVNSNVLPELQPHCIEMADLRKRAKHLLKCKEAVWRRWSKEYVCSLREKHRAQATAQGNAPAIGDVVMVRTEERNRGKWPLGIVEDLIVGTDGVVKGAILRPGKSRIERAVQHFYPLELSCNRRPPHLVELNP